eukprot:3925909-Rhodomonas_salina.1
MSHSRTAPTSKEDFSIEPLGGGELGRGEPERKAAMIASFKADSASFEADSASFKADSASFKADCRRLPRMLTVSPKRTKPALLFAQSSILTGCTKTAPQPLRLPVSTGRTGFQGCSQGFCDNG